jgi:hypothetical protein
MRTRHNVFAALAVDLTPPAWLAWTMSTVMTHLAG